MSEGMIQKRMTPNNLEAEQSVIGAMILDKKIMIMLVLYPLQEYYFIILCLFFYVSLLID